jgi:DNA (cytosine-5)-methyltransferase 1
MTELNLTPAKRNCDGQPSLAPATGYAAPLRLLDLFCCEGGAGTGYARAGFDVTGVDIVAKPRNPHPVIVADAIEYAREHAHEYDAIHASPPCQSYSRSFKHMATPQPMLIDAVREILKASGKPWVIENVVGAPLANDSDLFGRHGVELCGTMFGLRIYRHRIFETNFPLPLPPAPCDHTKRALNPFNDEGWHRIREEYGDEHTPEKVWRLEMGVPWMGKEGAREAVPPCFTEWIGRELLRVAARHNIRS